MADLVVVLIVIVFFGMAVALVAGCNKMLGEDAEYELDGIPTGDPAHTPIATSTGAPR